MAASTYTANNGIEKIGSGEQSGSWDTTTNLNFDLIDEALDGQVQDTLPAVGTTGSPNTLTISDGSSSDGRHRFVEFIDGGDLGGTAYVQLNPNDAEKVMFVRNTLSSSRDILIFQGTYNASNDFLLVNGKDALIKFDGAGSGAVVTGILLDMELDSLTLTTPLAVADGGTAGATQGAAQTGLGLAIGTDVQAYDAGLLDIAGLAVTDSNVIVGDGANWVAETGTTLQTSLGLAIGTNVQAWDAQLDTIAAGSAANATAVTNLTGTNSGDESAASDSVAGIQENAVASEIRNKSAALTITPANLYLAAAVVALTPGANVALDMDSGINFSLAIAQTATLDNPTNNDVGQSGYIEVTQGGAGSFVLSYGSEYKFPGGTTPILSTAVGAIDILYYTVRSATEIDITLLSDVK